MYTPGAPVNTWIGTVLEAPESSRLTRKQISRGHTRYTDVGTVELSDLQSIYIFVLQLEVFLAGIVTSPFEFDLQALYLRSQEALAWALKLEVWCIGVAIVISVIIDKQ